MSTPVTIEPLTPEGFAPFGQVLETGDTPVMINAGNCARHHDLCAPDIDASGRAGISLFHGQPYGLPLEVHMLERHPLGSQAFLPMSADPFLVTVAEDDAGIPVRPRSFLTRAGQGVQIGRNVWHGVLTPLWRPATFAVVDYIGPLNNLEEFWLEAPITASHPAP